MGGWSADRAPRDTIGSGMAHSYIWSYRVREEHLDDFLDAWGPDVTLPDGIPWHISVRPAP